MDVNILLAAGFCGRHGRTWTQLLCTELMILVAPIRERYVLPMRNLRRQAEECAVLYDALKVAELEAERMEIEVLASHIAIKTTAGSEGRGGLENLVVYTGLFTDVGHVDVAPKLSEMANKFAEMH